MTRADLDKWDPRYASGQAYGGAPDPFFVDVAAAWLPPTGTALDLAGGSGRHALWLASRGLDTTLVDIAPSALALARAAAAERGLTLHTLAADLDAGLPAGRWDVVLVSFFLVRPYLDRLADLLAPGGILMMVHPTERNLERHAQPSRRWLFEEGELTGVPGLDTVHIEEGWGSGGRHEVRYVGRKPAT